MKQILLILVIVLAGLQLKAQLARNKHGRIISFSSSEKYKAKIEKQIIPSFTIPYMDNDSLCRAYNNGKSFEELENGYISGFYISFKPISLKKKGICIQLEQGRLWRYTIEGSSAGGIDVDLGFPKLPKGTYIALIAADTTINLVQSPKVFHSENLLERHKKRGLRSGVFGKKLIIEYFEPSTLKETEDIFIKKIGYSFEGFGIQKSSYNNNLKLKSGAWGNSDYSQCQKDVTCRDIGNYENEAKSVVFLLIYGQYCQRLPNTLITLSKPLLFQPLQKKYKSNTATSGTLQKELR